MSEPLSMTAFGRGEHTADNRTWTAEIRSVNHRNPGYQDPHFSQI